MVAIFITVQMNNAQNVEKINETKEGHVFMDTLMAQKMFAFPSLKMTQGMCGGSLWRNVYF